MDTTDPANTACEQLGAFFQHLLRLRTTMPFQPLSLAERRERGGHLFPNGPGLVLTVGQALTDRPELYTDLGVDGQALHDQQRLACRWRFVRDTLLTLAQLASDSFLCVQSSAIRTAQAVVRTVKDAPPPPAGPDRTGERNLALVPAYFIVHHYQQTLARRKERRRQQRQAAAPATSPRPPSPAQVRAEKTDREGRRAAFDAAFLRFAETTRPAAPAPAAALADARGSVSRWPISDMSAEAIAAALPETTRAALRRLLC